MNLATAPSAAMSSEVMSVTFLFDVEAAGVDRGRSTADMAPQRCSSRPVCRGAPVIRRSVPGGGTGIGVGAVPGSGWCSACSGTGAQVVDGDREYRQDDNPDEDDLDVVAHERDSAE